MRITLTMVKRRNIPVQKTVGSVTVFVHAQRGFGFGFVLIESSESSESSRPQSFTTRQADSPVTQSTNSFQCSLSCFKFFEYRPFPVPSPLCFALLALR